MAAFDFNVRRLEVSDLRDARDALREIHRGSINMLIIDGVFSRDAMSTVAARLAIEHGGFDVTPQMSDEVRDDELLNYGRGITPNSTELSTSLDGYLSSAPRFRARCRELFSGVGDFEEILTQTLSKIAGGRPVQLARHANGREYTPATIRYLPPERQIPLHVGDFFMSLPVYDDLRARIEGHGQLSYFVPIRRPEGGGKLTVYDLKHGAPNIPWSDPKCQWPDPERVERQFASIQVDPPQGSLLVFDGGRYYHYVDRVQGPHARLTIGGFMAFRADDSAVEYWA